MPAIAVSELTKVYRRGKPGTGVKALDGLSLNVEQGEIFGFLGPNGAGKTTFIKILLSLVQPTSGTASLLDRPLPNTGIRARIGYLPENHRYPSFLTGSGVLNYFGRLSGVPASTIAARAPELLRLVNMEEWKKTKIRRYSKGMLQRIGLAQALINDPDLIFLDEPTDGVDPVGRKEIRDLLKGLRAQGKTIFLNSHLLSEVELICDRVAIINRGTVLKAGTIEELTSSGNRYVIGIQPPLPASLKTEAAALVLRMEDRIDNIVVSAPTPAELNGAIDLLRRHGVVITSIQQDKTTLEESFLALLKKEATA